MNRSTRQSDGSRRPEISPVSRSIPDAAIGLQPAPLLVARDLAVVPRKAPRAVGVRHAVASAAAARFAFSLRFLTRSAPRADAGLCYDGFHRQGAFIRTVAGHAPNSARSCGVSLLRSRPCRSRGGRHPRCANNLTTGCAQAITLHPLVSRRADCAPMTCKGQTPSPPRFARVLLLCCAPSGLGPSGLR